MIILPPYLKKGDTIGIVCPSGFMDQRKMQVCINTLQQWGFMVKTGKTADSKSKNYFSGTDEERLQDLQTMLDDAGIKAILFGRGGYGLSRIIDDINFKRFKMHPKWLLGFSDITVIQTHLLSVCHTASIHCSMAAAFNENGADTTYIQSIRKALTGQKINYKIDIHPLNKAGTAEGRLVGGNLALLAHLSGTRSALNTKGKILFLEDIGEFLYNIDRMLIQLKRTGLLNQLSGLIIGQFSDLKDTALPFGQNVYELIFDKVKEYNYPVCFNFPVGHVPENVPLKIGLDYKLKVSSTKVQFAEINKIGNS